MALRYFTLLYIYVTLFLSSTGIYFFLRSLYRGVGEAGWVSLLAMEYWEEERVRKVIERDVCV